VNSDAAQPKAPEISAPRVLIAGLRGSGGKTMVALGLAAAWTRRGRRVAPFKKGADYIDAAWLASATGRPCRNLDLFMLEKETLRRSFQEGAAGSEVALIEGNRGLFDGLDVHGSCSSAELAKLLDVPVILVCDATKATRTVAAMVLGCLRFDPEVDIRGVVLNRVAGPRHERILREVIAEYTGLPVLGVIPRLPADPFPERHLGLVPPQEHDQVPAAVDAAAAVAEAHLDLDACWACAQRASPLPRRQPLGRGDMSPSPARPAAESVRIAVFRDAAFQFYYPENLEALERAGGRLVELSPLVDEVLPQLDAIYIGGGFPETWAGQLAANAAFRGAVAEAVAAGVPVYAECAGAVYLGETLVLGENRYPMVGAIPAVFGFGKRPQGHGYSIMEVEANNPYYPVGTILRGHEFHYTRVLELDEKAIDFAFGVRRGYGVDGSRDGICRHNALAAYCHIHALGVPEWAGSLVRAALDHKLQVELQRSQTRRAEPVCA
jgi:cobyrinic acid a,c-diamide synthase